MSERRAVQLGPLWVALLCTCITVQATWEGNLRFRPDGTFKIVQFTDLHMGEAAGKDNNTIKVMDSVLSAEGDVDLVVLSGDMLSGWMGTGKEGWVEQLWPRVLTSIERHGVPYAYINGNHDYQANLDRRGVVLLDAAHPLSLTQAGSPYMPGASNYHLPICSSVTPTAAAGDGAVDAGAGAVNGGAAAGAAGASPAALSAEESVLGADDEFPLSSTGSSTDGMEGKSTDASSSSMGLSRPGEKLWQLPEHGISQDSTGSSREPLDLEQLQHQSQLVSRSLLVEVPLRGKLTEAERHGGAAGTITAGHTGSDTSSSSSSSTTTSSGDGDSCHEAARIWMVDTLDEYQCALLGHDCCERRVPDWLKQEAEAMGDQLVPGIAFTHIPTIEHMITYDNRETWGNKDEKVSCYPQSGCLVRALKAAGVSALYSGHDHNNNFYGTLGGIRLGYGQKTGYGSYGPPPGIQKGARVMLLREGEQPGEGETWIRYEDGSKEHQKPATGWRYLKTMVWPRQVVCNWL